MEPSTACKWDRIAHDIFAATLRSSSTSPREEAPDSRRLKYADCAAALAKRLSDPRTLKLNLLRLPRLRTLSAVEADFLKAAIPALTCAARPYNSKLSLESGTAVLNAWAGCSGASTAAPSDEVTEMFISPQAFKNTLLRILNGNSDDNRVVAMRDQLVGVPWSTSIEADAAAGAAADDDETQCTFHPKLCKYPQYLQSTPKLAYPKDTALGKLKQLLETSPRRPVEDYEGYPSASGPEDGFGQTDYGSPFNNACPFSRTLREEADDRGLCNVRGHYEAIGHEACGRMSRVPAGPLQTNDRYVVRDCDVIKGNVNYCGNVRPNVDDDIDAIIASLPGMKLRPAPPQRRTGLAASLRFVTPRRHRLCSKIDRAPDASAGYDPASWEDRLRGGFLESRMRLSIGPDRQSLADAARGGRVAARCTGRGPQKRRLVPPAHRDVVGRTLVAAVTVAVTAVATVAAPTALVAAAAARPLAGQLRQLGADGLVGLAHQLDELPRDAVLVGSQKGVRSTLVATTPSAPNAVHVVLNLVGKVKVNDHLDVAHVQTARSDVSRNHDGVLAALELVENPVALLLLLVAVNAESRPAVEPELLGERVGGLLGVGEDEHLGAVADLGEDLLELSALLVLFDDKDFLRYVVAGLEVERPDVDVDGLLAAEVVGERLHLLGPRGRPHQRLPVRPDLADDLANLRLETHVEHAIGLVQDQVGDAPQVGDVGLEEVDEAAGAGEQNLDATPQFIHLLSELRALLTDLLDKFPGGSQDQDNGAVSGPEEVLRINVHYRRQQEGESLSRTGLRNSDDVPTGQGDGPPLHLDGGGRREPGGGDGLEDVVGEGGVFEGNHGLGHVTSGDYRYLPLLSDAVGVGRAHGLDVVVLLVEVLLERNEGLLGPVDGRELAPQAAVVVAGGGTAVTTVASGAAAVAAVAAAGAVAPRRAVSRAGVGAVVRGARHVSNGLARWVCRPRRSSALLSSVFKP
ncbi:serine beta-lactamase mitochondrial, putative [Babesia caballi]|uniref:Serine beta-lactamase mitochondrial, putative n=1 Tax=Babesia caballi TaxID=5871 RepID=A0AAV4LWX3_BABCB|nr:serine beta-lactamase mitochondrial, putative [Babesia caballi]